MKQAYSLLTLLLCLSIMMISLHCKGYEDLKMTYKQFKTKFQKTELTPDQQSQRELIFYSNLEKLKIKLDDSCQYCGVTKFFDQNEQQFKSRMGLLPQQNGDMNKNYTEIPKTNLTPERIQSSENLIKVEDLPSSKNWADEGKITSIKNQGGCGTCWSFATVAAIQSSLVLKGQSSNSFFYEPDLSEQFLLTCAAHGSCQGGYIQQAINLAYDKGVPYEHDVPYQGQKGDQSICENVKKNVKYTDGNKSGFSYYNIGDSQIINLLQTGPVMIALSADNWEYYAGGTFSCKANAEVNHAVLLVGYDSEKWIVKNQWGTNWGQQGYIYITRNKMYNCQVGSAVHQLWSYSLICSSFLMLLSFLLLL